MPEDGHDRSQDLILLERAIHIGKRVATGDEGVAAFGDEPVGYKPLVAIAQHNLAGPQFRGAWRRRTVRMSPGHTEGSMLVPVTFRRTSPNRRATSAARSRLTPL